MNCNFAASKLSSRLPESGRFCTGIFYGIARDPPPFLHSTRGREIAVKEASPAQVPFFESAGVSHGRYQCKTVAKLQSVIVDETLGTTRRRSGSPDEGH
jgi:hypothetical protein